jgi:hypothetical protein
MCCSKGPPKGGRDSLVKSGHRARATPTATLSLALKVPLTCTKPLPDRLYSTPPRVQHHLCSTCSQSANKRTHHNGCQPPSRATLTPNHFPRTAMHRGAAWPPAARPSSCVAVQPAVSRWAGTLTVEPSWLPSAACAARSNTGRRPSGVVVPGNPDAHRALVALSASTCLASARPVSGVCPVSARPVSARPISSAGVRVQCPVRASGIRVHFVRTGKFVERLGAAGSHTPRDRPAG